jgi:nuclear mRNA export protein SAC3
MDGPAQPRGRGFRINGASSRPHSRNKHWVAGQDNSGHSSDGERWERGGGHRRGRGRGRGSGRSTPQQQNVSSTHLAVPVAQDEVMSGTDDEGGFSDVQSVNGAEDDGIEVAEPDDNEPQTEEERAKFYQEVRLKSHLQT